MGGAIDAHAVGDFDVYATPKKNSTGGSTSDCTPRSSARKRPATCTPKTVTSFYTPATTSDEQDSYGSQDPPEAATAEDGRRIARRLFGDTDTPAAAIAAAPPIVPPRLMRRRLSVMRREREAMGATPTKARTNLPAPAAATATEPAHPSSTPSLGPLTDVDPHPWPAAGLAGHATGANLYPWPASWAAWEAGSPSGSGGLPPLAGAPASLWGCLSLFDAMTDSPSSPKSAREGGDHLQGHTPCPTPLQMNPALAGQGTSAGCGASTSTSTSAGINTRAGTNTNTSTSSTNIGSSRQQHQQLAASTLQAHNALRPPLSRSPGTGLGFQGTGLGSRLGPGTSRSDRAGAMAAQLGLVPRTPAGSPAAGAVRQALGMRQGLGLRSPGTGGVKRRRPVPDWPWQQKRRRVGWRGQARGAASELAMEVAGDDTLGLPQHQQQLRRQQQQQGQRHGQQQQQQQQQGLRAFEAPDLAAEWEEDLEILEDEESPGSAEQQADEGACLPGPATALSQPTLLALPPRLSPSQDLRMLPRTQNQVQHSQVQHSSETTSSLIPPGSQQMQPLGEQQEFGQMQLQVGGLRQAQAQVQAQAQRLGQAQHCPSRILPALGLPRTSQARGPSSMGLQLGGMPEGSLLGMKPPRPPSKPRAAAQMAEGLGTSASATSEPAPGTLPTSMQLNALHRPDSMLGRQRGLAMAGSGSSSVGGGAGDGSAGGAFGGGGGGGAAAAAGSSTMGSLGRLARGTLHPDSPAVPRHLLFDPALGSDGHPDSNRTRVQAVLGRPTAAPTAASTAPDLEEEEERLYWKDLS